MLKLFSFATLLFMVMGCQEGDESTETDFQKNDFECVVKIHDMSDNDITLSKKVKGFKKKTGKVFLYNFETEEYDVPYQTLKISNKNGTLMQEWFLSDLHEDYFEAYTVPNKEDATKTEYFYKWQGDLFDMFPGSWDEYIANEDREEEKGFHIANVIDWQKFQKIVGDFSDGCDALQIKYDGAYSPSPNMSNYGNGHACLWLFPVNSTYEYYGMAPSIHEGCGVYGIFTPGKDSFTEMCTNDPDVYARVRLVRDIPAGKW